MKTKNTFLIASLVTSSVLLSACSSTEKKESYDVVAAKYAITVTELAPGQIENLEVSPDKPPKEYLLAQKLDQATKNLDSREMHKVSKGICEKGYVKVSRQVLSSKSIQDSDLRCYQGGCQVELNWHIRCMAVPEEKFTIFGKS